MANTPNPGKLEVLSSTDETPKPAKHRLSRGLIAAGQYLIGAIAGGVAGKDIGSAIYMRTSEAVNPLSNSVVMDMLHNIDTHFQYEYAGTALGILAGVAGTALLRKYLGKRKSSI